MNKNSHQEFFYLSIKFLEFKKALIIFLFFV